MMIIQNLGMIFHNHKFEYRSIGTCSTALSKGNFVVSSGSYSIAIVVEI